MKDIIYGIGEIIITVIIAASILLAILLIEGFILRFLWNDLVQVVFLNTPEIGLITAMKLILLINIFIISPLTYSLKSIDK